MSPFNPGTASDVDVIVFRRLRQSGLFRCLFAIDERLILTEQWGTAINGPRRGTEPIRRAGIRDRAADLRVVHFDRKAASNDMWIVQCLVGRIDDPCRHAAFLPTNEHVVRIEPVHHACRPVCRWTSSPVPRHAYEAISVVTLAAACIDTSMNCPSPVASR